MDAITIPLEHGLLLSAMLFSIGFAGVMVRRNLIFILMSLEIMLNASAMAFGTYLKLKRNNASGIWMRDKTAVSS